MKTEREKASASVTAYLCLCRQEKAETERASGLERQKEQGRDAQISQILENQYPNILYKSR